MGAKFSFLEGELDMPDDLPASLRDVLRDKLAESAGREIADSTPRTVFGRVGLPGKATAIVGMRRAGKTTFLHQLRRERLEAGATLEHLPYVNLEDERLAGLKGSQLGFLLEEHERRVAGETAGSTTTWCFDEIQVVPGWERFVRRLLDTEGHEVLVTGSSATLLSREIATSLRGRAWEVPLFPFSFGEALRHRGENVPAESAQAGPRVRARLERALGEWLETGGFPEAQGLDRPSRAQLLRDYVDVAILRDVVERHGVANVAGLRWLVRHLIGNAASSFSVEKFYGALKSQGIAISKDTIHQLLAHLEDCFLVRLVWMEAASERQRMVNPRKAYPVDQGLIPVFDRTGRANLGHALETAVLIELERRRCSVTYVRTRGGREVDFLARDLEGRSELIQVTADASDPATAEREVRGLVEALAEHPGARARLLAATRDALPRDVPPPIVAQSAIEWLLEAPGSA